MAELVQARLLFEALGRLRLQDPPRPHDPAPHRREESLAEKPPRGILSRDSSAAATAPVVKSEAGSIGSNASYTRRCREAMAEALGPRPRLTVRGLGSSPLLGGGDSAGPARPHDPAPHRREESLAEKPPRGILSRDSSAAATAPVEVRRRDPSGATPPTPVGVGGDGGAGPRPRLLFEALGRLRLQDPPRPHDPAPHRREESLAEKPPRGILSRDSSAAATAPVVKSEAGSIGSNASYTRRCRAMAEPGPRPRLLFEALGRLRLLKTPPRPHDPAPHRREESLAEKPQGAFSPETLGGGDSAGREVRRRDPSGATPPTPVGVDGDAGPRPRLFEALGRLRSNRLGHTIRRASPPRGVWLRSPQGAFSPETLGGGDSAGRSPRRDPSGVTPPTPVGVGGRWRSWSKASTVVRGLGSSPPSRPARPHDPARLTTARSLWLRSPLGHSLQRLSAAATAPVVKSEAGSIGSNASYTRRCRRRWRSRSKASTVVRGLGSSPPFTRSATRSGAPPPRGVSG